MELLQQVKARFALEPQTESALWAHWNAILDVIEKDALGRRPKPKVFEVHHMNEVARKSLLIAFVEHKPDSELEFIALKAIGLSHAD